MGTRSELTGQTYGELYVDSFAYVKNGRVYWHTICECGTKSIQRGGNLQNGHTTSCGCKQGEKHGQAANGNKTPEYSAWAAMKRRCHNPKEKAYKYYGGRGITVCAEWFDSFAQFLADMGKRPTPDHSIGRIDNDGGYCKDNCEWQTDEQQANNKSSSHWITINDETMTETQCCRKYGVKRNTYQKRRKLGWSVTEALEGK